MSGATTLEACTERDLDENRFRRWFVGGCRGIYAEFSARRKAPADRCAHERQCTK